MSIRPAGSDMTPGAGRRGLAQKKIAWASGQTLP
jgi:hypothetical protein